MADGVKSPTPERLRELLDYNPETGLLTWRERPAEAFRAGCLSAEDNAKRWNARYANTPAFDTRVSDGYLAGRIDHVRYRTHRVAWAMHYGVWPEGQIDHINHDPADNRIANLRAVSQAQNQLNRPRQSNNKSGVVGVRWLQRGDRWEARIGHNNKDIFLGVFDSFEEAVAARKAKEQSLGFHPNHGRARS